MKKKNILLTLLCLLALAPVSAQALPPAAQKAAESRKALVIPGTGDSEVLLRTLAQLYTRNHPGITVEIPESIGSGGGIRAVLGGKSQIARVARPITEKESSQGLTSRIFALAPIVFAVSSGVAGVTNLSCEQILGIYSEYLLAGKVRHPGNPGTDRKNDGRQGKNAGGEALAAFFFRYWAGHTGNLAFPAQNGSDAAAAADAFRDFHRDPGVVPGVELSEGAQEHLAVTGAGDNQRLPALCGFLRRRRQGLGRNRGKGQKAEECKEDIFFLHKNTKTKALRGKKTPRNCMSYCTPPQGNTL